MSGHEEIVRTQKPRGVAVWKCGKPSVRGLFGRFWEKVQFGRPDECWIWSGARNLKGYGSFGRGFHDTILAHHLAFEFENGWNAPYVMHTCDTPPCVNPRHLRAGSPAENSRDMVAKDRSPRGERAPGAKLTEADILTIREAAPKTLHRFLAARYGVSRQTIGDVVRGRRWRHVSSLSADRKNGG